MCIEEFTEVLAWAIDKQLRVISNSIQMHGQIKRFDMSLNQL